MRVWGSPTLQTKESKKTKASQRKKLSLWNSPNTDLCVAKALRSVGLWPALKESGSIILILMLELKPVLELLPVTETEKREVL